MPKPITPNPNDVNPLATIVIPADGDSVAIDQFWSSAIQQLANNASAATSMLAMSLTTVGSGTITIPAWARFMYYYVVGGGGGGGGGMQSGSVAGAGGSSGQVVSGLLPVVGIQTLGFSVGAPGAGGVSSEPPANGAFGGTSAITIPGVVDILAIGGGGGLGGTAGGVPQQGTFRGGGGGNNDAGGSADTYFQNATQGTGNPTPLPSEGLPIYLRRLWLNAPQEADNAPAFTGGIGGNGYGAGGGGGAASGGGGFGSGGGQGAPGWLNPLDLTVFPTAEDGASADDSRNGGDGTAGLVSLLFIG